MLKSMFIIVTGLALTGTVMAEQMAPPAAEATPVETTAPEITETETEQPATTEPAQTTEMAEEQSGFSRGSVMRATFTNGIENREPIDNMKSAGNNSNKITFFTELRDMSGQTARHRWEHNGEVMAEVEFNVRGPRWRVWSSKSLLPKWEGEWKVSVLNAAGDTISEELITYKEPAIAGSTEAVEAAPEMQSDDPAPGLYEPSATDSPQ